MVELRVQLDKPDAVIDSGKGSDSYEPGETVQVEATIVRDEEESDEEVLAETLKTFNAPVFA